jgi:hypothetical protein
MALTMAAALLGSAIIGGGASVIASSSNSKAINKATNAQTQTADRSIALQREMYDKNNALLSPTVQRGDAAGSAYNALLGLGGDTAGAKGAFDNYLGSAGYQFQLGEANKGANAGFAAAGALDSGAAVKASQDRAQNMSAGFFGNYLGFLDNQQKVGLGASSALAGVGQTYANNVTNLNTQIGNSVAQGAMAKASNTNSLLGNLSSSFGLGLGALTKFGGGGYQFGMAA